jgi:hypothetical protein
MFKRFFLVVKLFFKYYIKDYTNVVKVLIVSTILRARREEKVRGEERVT